MPGRPHILRFFLSALVTAQTLTAQQPKPQDFFPGFSATPAQAPFAGVSATANESPLPGFVAGPIASVPLAASPAVLGLEHLEPAQMSDADTQLVAGRHADLSQAAALASFDISQTGWHYEQVTCPSFPDFVVLAFSHGPDEEGSSRFAAILPRDGAAIRIVAAYAHGLLPFASSWGRPGSFAVFNDMLRRQRGESPLSQAPDWLLIGMFYAEVSGYPVQVLSTVPNPEPTLDMLRLDGNRPQLVIAADQSVDVTFSDVSRPAVTTNWDLHFNSQGAITGASQGSTRQLPAIALTP